jgi:hypothetical protein
MGDVLSHDAQPGSLLQSPASARPSRLGARFGLPRLLGSPLAPTRIPIHQSPVNQNLNKHFAREHMHRDDWELGSLTNSRLRARLGSFFGRGGDEGWERGAKEKEEGAVGMLRVYLLVLLFLSFSPSRFPSLLHLPPAPSKPLQSPPNDALLLRSHSFHGGSALP